MEHDGDFNEARAHKLARLATLQRLKEHAKAGNRLAMLKSIEDLIEQESQALRESADAKPERA